MTPEPPPPSRHPRPGVNARRQALGLDPGAPPAATRESLRDSLARIPDLTSEVPAVVADPAARAAPAPAAEPAAAPAAAAAVAVATPPAKVASTTTAPKAIPVPDALPPNTVPQPPTTGKAAPVPVPAGPRGRPPMWRRITFAVVLIGLVASIPVLVLGGYHLISESTAGDFDPTNLTPQDPGFEAQVDPTPTAVAIQYDEQRLPNAVTFMSVSGTSGGGTVVFVPLDTEVSEPVFGVDTLRRSYEVVADRPVLARERLASQVGRLLNVGIGEIIDVDNASWSQLVAPVAPLEILNPDSIDLGFGVVLPTGEAELQADQTGLYLAALKVGESDLNRLNRHEAVWSAWLEQVAASGTEDSIPGESTAGMGRFARELAAGPVSYSTLPVDLVPEDPGRFRIDTSEVSALVTDAVASPTAAVPGSRFTVRLLNGVSPDSIPADVVRQIVSRGGAVTVLGNGPSFDTAETTVVYGIPENKDVAELVAKALGATGTVRLDREAPDTVDITIVLGRDILGDTTGSGTPGATTPETSEGN